MAVTLFPRTALFVAAVTEDCGSFASNAHCAFDPYIFPQEKNVGDRIGHTEGLTNRNDFLQENHCYRYK